MKTLNITDLQEFFEAEDFTNDINQAIFLFADGTMLDGCFCDGMRGEDHNVLKSCFDDTVTWKNIHDSYNVIRLVPETLDALISANQEITAQQEEVLKYSDYGLMTYC